MNQHKWAVAETVNNIALAEILKGLLEAQEILVHISREGYESAIGLTGLPSTQIDILVSDDQIDEAKLVIKAYYQGDYS